MGINSHIGWTNHTLNFWMGCHKVSSGCKNCYMFRDYGDRWKNDANLVKKASQKTIDAVLKKLQIGDMVFTCSWSDFFIEEADPWRDEAWAIIKSHPEVNWQILTKRPERIGGCLPADWGKTGYKNVWLGVSIENQDHVDRLLTLHDIKNRSSRFKTFVSAEPLLGFLDFEETVSTEFGRLDWVIIGGESGNESGKFSHRRCELFWIEKVVKDARKHRVPVFVKQLGTGLAKQLNCSSKHGADIFEFPDSIKFQQFPRM